MRIPMSKRKYARASSKRVNRSSLGYEKLEDRKLLAADFGVSAESLLADQAEETGAYPWVMINDDIYESSTPHGDVPINLAAGEEFDAVVSLRPNFGGTCTGTLIAPTVVLTAAHCKVEAGDLSFVKFGADGNDDFRPRVIETYNPGGVYINGEFLKGDDVTLLRIDGNAVLEGYTPMRLIDATDDLVGMKGQWIGYGNFGSGTSGQIDADGKRRRAENMIDVYGSPVGAGGANIFSSDFDDGTSENNGTGSQTPLRYEGMGSDGNSGGPMLVNINGEWLVGGVVSGGTNELTSVYGTIGWWTGTAKFREQIESWAPDAEFVVNNAGSVNFDSETYVADNSINIEVLDGNAGDVEVTVTSDSGDSETITISPSQNSWEAGHYAVSIPSSTVDGTLDDDGILHVSVGEQIRVTYTDLDDGAGNSVSVKDTAFIVDVVPAALIGIDFDGFNGDMNPPTRSPVNWLRSDSTGTTEDLFNEEGVATTVHFEVTGESTVFGGNWEYPGFPVGMNDTVPEYTGTDLDRVDSVVTATWLEFKFSELQPLTEYDIYVMSAKKNSFLSPSVQQTVSIKGNGDAESFNQQSSLSRRLIINDAVGDPTMNLTDYAWPVTSDMDGIITINVDPMSGSQVAVAGLGIKRVSSEPIAAAPEIVINNGDVSRSIIDEIVVRFDDIVSLDANAFELIQRDEERGDRYVNVIPSIDNSNDYSVVTLTFSGAFVESPRGSLEDGNYQLTVIGERIISSSGVSVDGDGDGFAGGNSILGDTETDNFFRHFGDLDGNRLVNVFDLLYFRQSWGSAEGDKNFEEQFDSNGDGVINSFDLMEFRNNYGKTLYFV